MANFEFTHLFDTATGEVSGSFTGEDLNSDALISLDELSAYNMTSTLVITFGMFSHDLSALNDFSYSISSNEILSLQSEAGTPSETTARTTYEATNVDGQVTTNLTVGDPNIALSSQGPSVTPLDQPPPPQPSPPRIKADFNGNGSNDIVYQEISQDLSSGRLIFFDPEPGQFDVFDPQANIPGFAARAVGNFDSDSNPEILIYNPTTGENSLFNPLDSVQFTATLRDPNNADAVLNTGSIVPTTAADFNQDQVFEIIYRDQSNGQNLLYDPITRQFSLLNNTSDIPLAAGQLDPDASLEIVYGDPESGQYRVFDFDSQTFSDLFPDPNQNAAGFLATGTLNVDANQPDLVVFQNQANDQTVAYNPATGVFESVLATTPGFISLA